MTDETPKPQTPGAAPGATPEATAQGQQRTSLPSFQIATQYVKDLSFENPRAPHSLAPDAPAPQVQVNVDVRTNQLDDKRYEVVLNVKSDAKAKGDQAFLVELSYAGVVVLGDDVKREHVAPLLVVEVPRYLFPFARAVIAEATRNGGFPPLLVQPIDFAELFRRQLQGLRERQQQAQAQAGGQATATPATGPAAPTQGPGGGGTA
ncbi:MAG: protein-export chaperone SecB [Azospirillaceae bacterium]